MKDNKTASNAAPKPKKSKIPTKSYEVISVIKTDKKTYVPGDKIQLSEKARRIFKRDKKIK